MTTIDVQIRPVWVEKSGYRYDAILDGDTIVRRSRDPEYDAARVLHAGGLRGRFRTIDFRTGKPRMILDIEKASGLRTVERERGGLTVERHLPMSADDIARLRPPSLHQGRVIPGEAVTSTGQPVEAAGGETAERSRRVPEDA